MLWTPTGRRTIFENAVCCRIGYAEDVDAVYASLFVEPYGVWRIPLDGRPPRQVLPPPPPPPEPGGEVSLHRDPIVVSPDGRRIAAGDCSLDGCWYVQVRAPGEDPPWGEAVGRPLGFDVRGNYLYSAGRLGPVRRLVVGGEDEFLARSDGEFRVLRRGRFLAVERSPRGRPETILELAALDGGQGWRRVLPGRWSLTDFGGQRYVVLEAEVPPSPALSGIRVRSGGHLVIDTVEGWLGYLPPISVDAMPPTDAVELKRRDSPLPGTLLFAALAISLVAWRWGRRRAELQAARARVEGE